MTIAMKLVSGFATAAMVAGLAVVPAFASADVDQTNQNTGPRSRNRNILELRLRALKDLRMRADIRNSVNISANTGDNEQNENTTAGDMDTGHVNPTVDILNEANQEPMDAGDPIPDVDVTVDQENDTTGPRSRNINRADIRSRMELNLRKTTDVRNTINISANTGSNEQNMNTAAGDMDTGDVSPHVLITNLAN